MPEIPVDEIERIAASLTAQEWEQLGGRQALPPKVLRQRLQDAFGRDFPETLWRRHKAHHDGLRHVHTLLSVEERERLGDTGLLSSPADYAQRILEVFDAGEVEELKARLQADRQRRQREREAERAASKGAVCTYDFKHPARVNRDQLRTLENVHENFARLLSATFSSAMRRVVEVNVAFVDQTTYGEFIASLSNPSASYQFHLAPTGGQAILDFAMPLVFGLVDRVFGGTGSAHGMPPRQMSQVEMGVVAKVVKRAVEDLEATWEPILPDVLVHDIELETNPEFMQITAPSEIVILLAFEVNAPGLSGLISLCYPFFTLEPVLPRLGQITHVRTGRPDREQSRADNRLRLGAMDLPVVVELGRTRIPAGQARTLAVGDVIRLDARADDPACVFVGGRPKLLGWPVAAGQSLAVQLAGRIPAPLQHRYGSLDSRRRT